MSEELRQSIRTIRADYSGKPLLEEHCLENPLEQFKVWLQTAIDCPYIAEPNAMVVATVDPSGAPSQRAVLLKDFSEDGVIFFTNYTSQKGSHLAQNNACAALFLWPALERQVRIEGHATRISSEASDRYFASRPLAAQVAACVSAQSQSTTRQALDTLFQQALQQAQSNAPARPMHWGGYQITPTRWEFWQGRSDRLHDRIIYSQDQQRSGWIKSRLAP